MHMIDDDISMKVREVVRLQADHFLLTMGALDGVESNDEHSNSAFVSRHRPPYGDEKRRLAEREQRPWLPSDSPQRSLLNGGGGLAAMSPGTVARGGGYDYGAAAPGGGTGGRVQQTRFIRD